MIKDNTFVYIIVAIVAIHFLLAIGYLVFKIMKAPKSNDHFSEKDSSEMQ